ncbi:Oxidoreductase family, NAD-binding Rossmann fold containing protein [Trichomonas vaginalis G3]|uniref:Oxidoreductase family, NAD-binding Rossmann fold containing protein n=1 Tax=Trichomonas vaginalis (strain ATCC PRA-98 / G3) TaxID=412133 RepID=A2GD32_TRIV3|nr:oxidoreductase protein [Trichomonas vaginalis G3]EAX84934.1 Oxidoreductase family, NAD-binding Rossmann fold containing protein [Trichomonas vaginalis G3]KAI5514433.1 oxidoreductase protein [Trichomonas vaginalis G3]|eukprot:XP_001297864.1 Oxidoreductase family, NAD-binding Rossmann fold containing protein [Trichomonas vaginalis G3]
MSGKKVRYGIIGYGLLSATRLVPEAFGFKPGWKKPEHAELVGVSSRSDRNRKEIENLGIKWYTVDEMINSPDIDAVFIVTPNLSHKDIAIRALKAGKHVLLEKPMTTNVEDAEEIVKVAQECNKSLFIDHMMVFNGLNIKAKEIVDSKAIGEINDFVFHMEFGLALDKPNEWRSNAANEVGGPIGDVGSHCMYSLEYILGSKITKIAATYHPKFTQSNVEDGAYIKVFLENGNIGTVRVSFADRRGNDSSIPMQMGYEIYGSKKVLRTYGTLFQFSGVASEKPKIRLELDDSEGNVEQVKQEVVQDIYQSAVEHHALSILEGKRIDGKDGLHSMRLIAAAHESAKNGGKVIEIPRD